MPPNESTALPEVRIEVWGKEDGDEKQGLLYVFNGPGADISANVAKSHEEEKGTTEIEIRVISVTPLNP